MIIELENLIKAILKEELKGWNGDIDKLAHKIMLAIPLQYNTPAQVRDDKVRQAFLERLDLERRRLIYGDETPIPFVDV